MAGSTFLDQLVSERSRGHVLFDLPDERSRFVEAVADTITFLRALSSVGGSGCAGRAGSLT